MLRPSRPMIRPFISSDGRWITETVCSAVWSAAIRCMAVTITSRAFSWASSRAARSMARAMRTASCSASSRTSSSRSALAWSELIWLTSSSAPTCSWCARARSSRVFSSSRSRSMSLRSRCSSMSARWSSCSSRWRSRRSRLPRSARLPRASSSASRWRRSFSSLASRMRSFCCVRARSTMSAAFSVASLIAWLAQIPRARKPSDADDKGHQGGPRHDHDIHHVPPVRPIAGRRSKERSRGRCVRCARDPISPPRDPVRSPAGNLYPAPWSTCWAAQGLVRRVAYGGRAKRVNLGPLAVVTW